MKANINFLVIILVISLPFGSCSSTKKLERMYNKGSVSITGYKTTVSFTTERGIVILPVEINGQTKNFLFDTGASGTVLQNKVFGATLEIGGASNRKVKMSYENVPLIKIGGASFEETFALNNELHGLEERVDNFGGIIGQPIISRANWLIDYPNKKMTISTANVADCSFQTIPIVREDSAPYITITIDGSDYKCVIDLGSSSTLSVPEDSQLAQHLESKYEFKTNERDVWTIGGEKTDKEKIGLLPRLHIGNTVFDEVEMNIKKTSQLRVGMLFFKDYQVYIDNTDGNYKIKKTI